MSQHSRTQEMGAGEQILEVASANMQGMACVSIMVSAFNILRAVAHKVTKPPRAFLLGANGPASPHLAMIQCPNCRMSVNI